MHKISEKWTGTKWKWTSPRFLPLAYPQSWRQLSRADTGRSGMADNGTKTRKK